MSEILPPRDLSSAQRVSTGVVTYLRTLIDSGELHLGDQLPPERELARKLKVSGASLRAGIALLEMVGILKICHGSGTFVFGTPKLITDSGLNSTYQQGILSSQFFEACCVIEGAIARLAAERFSKRLVVDLAEEVMEMYAAFDDPQKYAVHEARFRQIIARAAANPILDALLETLLLNSGSSQLQRSQPSRDLRQSAAMHREIYRAIRSRNTIRARILMEQHLRETFRKSKVEDV